MCGNDKKTYANSCEAEFAGVKVNCKGKCPCMNEKKCCSTDNTICDYTFFGSCQEKTFVGTEEQTVAERNRLTSVCGAAVSYSCTNEIGCPAGQLKVTRFVDNDHDGYGIGNPVSICANGDSLPTGYAKINEDCYDSNSNAYPGSAYWSASNRGDGSFDYNCDGIKTFRYTQFPDCSANRPEGWIRVGVPECGETSDWSPPCACDHAACAWERLKKTQECQ